jgi:pyruvate dehydrogenase E1 component alpha subunit
MYKQMVRIRKFERRVVELFAEAKIPGFVHTSIGEEAIPVGACTCLNKDDYMTSTHRGHGHLLAKGGNMSLMMAELFGKETGYCKGKGGSMHIADLDLGILGANGLVGGGITIATGAGLSAKMRGTKQVTVCFFGDGASNQGAFHEGLNLASIWDLPVLYVCENNLYALSTPHCQHQRIQNISDRAVAYGIPGVSVDGNDVMGVYEVVDEAVKRARKGAGPTLIECKTYRHRGHEEGDAEVYRTKEEVREWLKKDPISRFGKDLRGRGMLSDETIKAIENEVDKEVEEAVRFAEESPEPRPELVVEDVYSDLVEEVRR